VVAVGTFTAAEAVGVSTVAVASVPQPLRIKALSKRKKPIAYSLPFISRLLILLLLSNPGDPDNSLRFIAYLHGDDEDFRVRSFTDILQSYTDLSLQQNLPSGIRHLGYFAIGDVASPFPGQVTRYAPTAAEPG
jgi:hypothetical protein